MEEKRGEGRKGEGKGSGTETRPFPQLQFLATPLRTRCCITKWNMSFSCCILISAVRFTDWREMLNSDSDDSFDRYACPTWRPLIFCCDEFYSKFFFYHGVCQWEHDFENRLVRVFCKDMDMICLSLVAYVFDSRHTVIIDILLLIAASSVIEMPLLVSRRQTTRK